MKKLLLTLSLLTLTIGFTGAYNCSTLASRLEDFTRRFDDFRYRYEIHASVGERVSNEYEASLWFQDYYKLEAEKDRLNAEQEVLFEEKEWCDDLRERYNNYIDKGDAASKKLANKGTYDEDLAKEALKYYKKAYDMLDYNFTDVEKKKSLIKELINSLESYIEAQEARIKAEKKAQEEREEQGKTTATETSTIQNSSTQTRLITKDEVLIEAIQRMYNNGLTIYNTPQDFLPNDEITREQASKFFVEFAAKVLGKDRGTIYNYNIFSDLGKADPTLKDHIIYANNMGLFKGTNGKFNPLNKLTKAQAIAVTVRMANGYMDENLSPRYLNYYYSADSYGLLRRGEYEFNTLDSKNISRGDMALILYSLYNYLNNN